MGDVEFDPAVAARVMTSASAAADLLRGQAACRRADAEDALAEFSGAHARAFEAAVLTESADRAALARVLQDLVDQVRRVSELADQEQRRRDAQTAWHARDTDRRATAADPVAAFTVAVFDPQPSEIAIRPTPVTASFTPRERPRASGASSGGSSDGRTSADPAHLRRYAERTRASTRLVTSDMAVVRTAWGAFRAACAWVPVDSETFLQGVERFASENVADAAWLDRIADAFVRAGGGHSLGDTALDIAATGVLPAALRRVLAAGLSADEVAERWLMLGFTRGERADIRALPIGVLTILGNLEGAPYWARDTANRVVLDHRIARLSKRSGVGLERLALEQVRVAVTRKDRDGVRSLVSLSADEPPLAAITIGDLDTATNVTWAVPGMGSSTRSMVAWTNATQHLYEQQAKGGGPSDRAVIAWMGYQAPSVPGADGADFGVFHTQHAAVGGDLLAASILGLNAARRLDPPTTNVVAHSYGSTTAALGLAKQGVHVDTFTTVGSAGIPDRIPHATALHADRVYAGQARNVIPFLEPGRGDQWAHVGRSNSTDHRQDPTAPDFGATAFGTDGSGSLQGVEDHGVHTAAETGYLDPDTESLTNVGYATTGRPDLMTEHLPKDLTAFERALLNGSGTRP